MGIQAIVSLQDLRRKINPYFPWGSYTDIWSTWATLSSLLRIQGSVNPDFDAAQQLHILNSSLRNQGGSSWPLQWVRLTGRLYPDLKESYIINELTARSYLCIFFACPDCRTMTTAQGTCSKEKSFQCLGWSEAVLQTRSAWEKKKQKIYSLIVINDCFQTWELH